MYTALGGNMDKWTLFCIAVTAALAACAVYFGFQHWVGLTAWFTAGAVSNALKTITGAIRDTAKGKG